MNLLFKLKYIRRRIIQNAQLRYAEVATWIPETYPDFMCIGAPRAATTWLFKRLQSDPRIFLPRAKELHFFDEKREFDYDDHSGLKWIRSFYFDMSNPAHFRWYSMQFLGGNGKKKGDMTPVYSALSRERVRLIFEKMPNLKVIYIIRNPIERAWSGMRKSIWYQKGRHSRYFDDQEKLMNTIMHPEVLRHGHYREAIEVWSSILPEDNILYLFYDDILADQEAELKKIYSFIDLDPPCSSERKVEKRDVNAAPTINMPSEVRRKLGTYYEDQIQYLESRFNRKLDHWRA